MIKSNRFYAGLLALSFMTLSGFSKPDDSSNRFEITPFGGYRLSGSLELDDPAYNKLNFGDSGIYGLAIGMKVTPGEEGGDAGLEIMWTHQDATLTAVPKAGVPSATLDMKVDQFHFNGLYAPPGFDGVRPYVIAGLGATRFAPKGDENSMTLFSWALGGGAKVPLTNHLALRFEAKWDPVVDLAHSSFFCNSATGQCFASASGEWINQIDVTAGLALGF